MWQFIRVIQLDLSIAKYKPKLAGSYMELPKALSDKKAIINIMSEITQLCYGGHSPPQEPLRGAQPPTRGLPCGIFISTNVQLLAQPSMGIHPLGA
eukprot:SAG31_NODE_189_length_20842_cov_12.518151_1_plen_96_part_00